MKNNAKKYHYVFGLGLIIIIVLFLSLSYESTSTVKSNVESTVNELTINYVDQLVMLNQHLDDFDRTAIGQPYVSDDKRYLVIDTVRSGIQDYDDIKTFLFDFREGKVVELEGNIAAWTGNSMWVVDYENNIATWYSMTSGMPESITSFNLSSETSYHFVVSPNEEYTAISGDGIRVINKESSTTTLSSESHAIAYVWKTDNSTVIGTVPNPNREEIPEEEFYGPLDNLLVAFDRNKEGYEIYKENDKLSSARALEWMDADTSLLVNSGFDDGSYDEIFLLDEHRVQAIGETSGVLAGRYIDTKTHTFLAMGEFYPEDFDFNTNNKVSQELRVYNAQGELDYQYIFEDESFTHFLNIRREGNIVWFVAHKAGNISNYAIGSLDMSTDTITFEPDIESETYIAFEILHNNQLLVQRDTRLEIISTKQPIEEEKKLP